MRRLVALLMLSAGLATAPAAFAQTPDPDEADGPIIDVVEIAGIIDRPLANYALEQIEQAEREKAALLVFQVNSPGFVKISDDQVLAPLVRRILDSKVPIAVHIGPRQARAAGGVVAMAAAAHASGIGPSAKLGPVHPLDAGTTRATQAAEKAAITELSRGRGRDLEADFDAVYGANESVTRGFVDMVIPSVADFLKRLDGQTVNTAAGSVTLRLPEDGSTVRFFQPGPIRRLLHTFSNPSLVFILIVAGAMLLGFELFQPGFGVAGGTGILLVIAAAYGLTVLPASWVGVMLLSAGFAAMTFDVVINALGPPTAIGTVGVTVGSILLFPRDIEPLRLSWWLIGLGVASALIMFVPVLTVVRRARTPIGREIRDALVGEDGEVRSMLNPEGFIWVAGELWRARTEDGTRMRVGETVRVVSIDGTLLIVRPS